MKSITKEIFHKEIIEFAGPVLAEFYADGCVPCRRLAPILAELEEEFSEMKFLKINAAFQQELARQYLVMSSPVILLFQDGKEAKRLVGAVRKKEVKAAINEVLA